MQANDHPPLRRTNVPARKQRGVAAVEFALVAILFFTLVFGILEIARVIYLFNVLQEVTRRAAEIAANSDFDQSTLESIRKKALFGGASGNLPFGEPVTQAHVKIDYLSLSRDGTTGVLTPQPANPRPACPAENHLNCVANPYGASCIRLVQVRVCQPGGAGDCAPVLYKMLFGFVDFSLITLPRAETIVPAQTLGYTFGSMPPCQ